jgi:hypothetical protein
LNHRNGPCSPVASKQRRMEEVLRLDELRADYVQRGAGGLEPSHVRVPNILASGLGSLEYIVSVGIGSASFGQTIIMDTGSDVSWVRCNTQVGRPFDPRASSSYAPFSCSSGECALLGQEGQGCSGDGQCQYAVSYYDGSYTTGTLASDKLALTDSEAIQSFQFGCSHSDGFDDRLDGLLGLGGGVQSLPSQTAGMYGSQFSYCLPPTPASSGFLTLGAPIDESSFTTTRMFRIPGHLTFYYVLLRGIKVAEKPLDLPPSIFAGGSVLDSGTVITRLPTTAYAALSSAFKDEMKQYPPGPPIGILDTCFDFGGQDMVMIPRVALVFDDGAVVELDANGIMTESCLAFAAGTNDASIIGNVQQRTYEVLYNVGQNIVGFRAGAC